jgi:hypothetical protein
MTVLLLAKIVHRAFIESNQTSERALDKVKFVLKDKIRRR